MNYIEQKEVQELKAEQKLSEETLAAEKYSYQHMLLTGLGEKMMEELRNPSKPKLSVGIKNRYRRWKTIRNEKKAEKKIKKGGF